MSFTCLLFRLELRTDAGTTLGASQFFEEALGGKEWSVIKDILRSHKTNFSESYSGHHILIENTSLKLAFSRIIKGNPIQLNNIFLISQSSRVPTRFVGP